MRILIDTHTHTLASGHAYNTIMEMARQAADIGLPILGITEHAPAVPGTCPTSYFRNLKIIPREMFGVRLLFGTEANIMDKEGNLDLKRDVLGQMDVVIASAHTNCYADDRFNRDEVTGAYRSALANPYVNIIGHPDDGRFAIDYKELVKGAKEHNKLLEINNASLLPSSSRKNARENDIEMLAYCREMSVPIIVNSDAHIHTRVGDFNAALQLLKEIGFPGELVANYDAALLAPILDHRKMEQK